MSIKIVFSTTLLLLVLSGISMGQVKQKTEQLSLTGWVNPATITYQYKSDNDAILKHGTYSFSYKDDGISQTINGGYKNGAKNGIWSYTTTFADYNQNGKYLSGQISLNAIYIDGYPNGKWTMSSKVKYREKHYNQNLVLVFGPYSKEVVENTTVTFSMGTIIGAFSYSMTEAGVKKEAITGKCDNNGFIDGQLIYNTTAIKETYEYKNGLFKPNSDEIAILTKYLYLEKNSPDSLADFSYQLRIVPFNNSLPNNEMQKKIKKLWGPFFHSEDILGDSVYLYNSGSHYYGIAGLSQRVFHRKPDSLRVNELIILKKQIDVIISDNDDDLKISNQFGVYNNSWQTIKQHESLKKAVEQTIKYYVDPDYSRYINFNDFRLSSWSNYEGLFDKERIKSFKEDSIIEIFEKKLEELNEKLYADQYNAFVAIADNLTSQYKIKSDKTQFYYDAKKYYTKAIKTGKNSDVIEEKKKILEGIKSEYDKEVEQARIAEEKRIHEEKEKQRIKEEKEIEIANTYTETLKKINENMQTIETLLLNTSELKKSIKEKSEIERVEEKYIKTLKEQSFPSKIFILSENGYFEGFQISNLPIQKKWYYLFNYYTKFKEHYSVRINKESNNEQKLVIAQKYLDVVVFILEIIVKENKEIEKKLKDCYSENCGIPEIEKILLTLKN